MTRKLQRGYVRKDGYILSSYSLGRPVFLHPEVFQKTQQKAIYRLREWRSQNKKRVLSHNIDHLKRLSSIRRNRRAKKSFAVLLRALRGEVFQGKIDSNMVKDNGRYPFQKRVPLKHGHACALADWLEKIVGGKEVYVYGMEKRK